MWVKLSLYIENTCRKLQTDDIQRSGHKLVKVRKSILVTSLLCLKGVAFMHRVQVLLCMNTAI